MKIHLPCRLRDRIYEHAKSTYPNECCGLIVGNATTSAAQIVDVHESDNTTSGDPRETFEVDPKLRFDVMRACDAASGELEIIGHYHSHPDHPAEPSGTDLKMIYEPNFFWLICGVTASNTGPINAFKPTPDGSRFDPALLEFD